MGACISHKLSADGVQDFFPSHVSARCALRKNPRKADGSFICQSTSILNLMRFLWDDFCKDIKNMFADKSQFFLFPKLTLTWRMKCDTLDMDKSLSSLNLNNMKADPRLRCQSTALWTSNLLQLPPFWFLCSSRISYFLPRILWGKIIRKMWRGFRFCLTTQQALHLKHPLI